MRKYIVLIICCLLSLLSTEAMIQPKDSIRIYSYSYDFDKEALLKEMEKLKVDLEGLTENLPDFSKYNFEFNDSVFRFYSLNVDTARINKLRNFAFVDSGKLKEFSENLKMDTSRLNKLRNLRVDTAGIRIFKGKQNLNKFYFNGSRAVNQTVPTRTEKKTFSNITKISFDHQYGDIAVIESPSKQVELEIKYFDTDGKKAIANVSSANNTLTVRTISAGKNSAKIHYVISIPKNTTLDIDLRYGNIRMGNYQGTFSSSLTYSNLSASSFVNTKPSISGRYGNVAINDVQNIAIDASYTNVAIKNVDRMELSGKHNNYTVDKVSNITGKSPVSGNFKIGSVENIDGDMKYVNMIIDNLGSSLSANCDYSNIKINNVSPRLTKLNINGRYSDVTLSLPTSVSASFSVNMKYGDFKVDKKYTIKYTEQSGTSKQIVRKGQIGSKKPTAVISISSSYSDIKFK